MVIKTICKEEVLSKGHLTATPLVFHKYLLVGDNPNPLGLFWIIRDWHTHYSLEAQNDVSKT